MDFVSMYLVPVAVLVSAGATSTSAVIAWKLYQAVETHERTLFGESDVEGYDGVVAAVNENTQRSETNRRVLRAHDLVGPGQGSEYRGDPGPDDPESPTPR